MAKTVAEIDGDSSGLVSELGKAKDGMVKLGTEGKKLSDQLRDVADQADVAAGNLINKIGGPGAITAIGGIGIAFAGVGKAVDLVGQSMDSFYNAQGDKGAAAMATINQSMDSLKGSLFEAVVGTNDLNAATDTVVATLRIAKSVFDALLLPISSVSTAIRQATSDEVALGSQVYETIKAQKLYAEQSAFVVTANANNKVAVDALIESLKIELSTQQALKLASEQKRLASIDEAVASIDAGVNARASIAGEIAMAKAREDVIGASRDRIAASMRTGAEQSGYFLTMDEARQKAMGVIERDGKMMARVHEAENQAYEAAVAKNNQIGAVELEQRNTLLTQKAELEQKYAEERLALESKASSTNTVQVHIGAAGPTAPTETAAEKEARELKAINDLRLANTKGEQQLELDKMKWDDQQRDAKYEKEKAAAESFLAFTKQMEDDHIAEIHARGELTDKEQEELNAERLKAVQDRTGEEVGLYMQSAAKQLAIGKLSAKAAADMARTQLANVIIGQGDKAMAEAGIMAAALNPLAVPMAAAGLAAYAIGNAMMPTAKPAAGTTPATEKPAEGGQAATNNYAFNMRVDSVFADGESVARQFAMMQESARARGLLMQGA
jgi:hypothetical protein